MEMLNYGQQSNKTLNDWLWGLAMENNEDLIVEIRNNGKPVARFDGSNDLFAKCIFIDANLKLLTVKYIGIYNNLVKIDMKQD